MTRTRVEDCAGPNPIWHGQRQWISEQSRGPLFFFPVYPFLLLFEVQFNADHMSNELLSHVYRHTHTEFRNKYRGRPQHYSTEAHSMVTVAYERSSGTGNPPASVPRIMGTIVDIGVKKRTPRAART